MYPILTSILIFVAIVVFVYSMYNRLLLMAAAKGSDNRLDQIPRRIKDMFQYAIGQKRFFKKRDLISGLMHVAIFWGFCVISIRTITLFGLGYSEGFHLPFFDGPVGDGYSLILNVFALLVSTACCYGLFRRLVTKPERLTKSGEAVFILCIILSLMITDFLFDGSRMVLTGEYHQFAFVGYALSGLMSGLPEGVLTFIQGASFLIHIALILAFLNFLPYGKHFHVITGIPNVFFRNLKPYGQLNSINLEDENATTFGNDKIEQFSAKNYLDWFTCTECGRCQDMCPAHNSEKPLSPKELTINLRNFLYAKQKKLNGKTQGQDIQTDEMGFIPDETPLLGDTISHDVLWACTTCRACEEACPVFIEYVQEIVDMRRNLVLMQGTFPTEVQQTFVNMERNYNPWGISFEDRGNWGKDIGVPTLEENPDVEYLYFVGCAGNFDERNKKVAMSLSKILTKAGVSFGILGKEEKCTGDAARRIGNEYLAQMLIKENVEVMNKYKVRKVITSCPHCFNTIKNEFTQFGGRYEVIHHTELLADLIKQGVLKPDKSLNQEIVYHDSCYLGRYNEVYDPPRAILEAIPGVKLKEPELTKKQGRCCGAGGGRMWMEETIGKRVNEMRLDDLAETKASMAATACPFCKIMIGDAINQTNNESIGTKDVVEILADSLGIEA
jgi:Fe-S oxidoreductase/nitrate reductase gamma subunit